MNSEEGSVEKESTCEMLKNYPDVLNVTQLCEILKISRKLAYRLLKEGKIKHLKIGRSYKIPKPFLLRYLCKN